MWILSVPSRPASCVAEPRCLQRGTGQGRSWSRSYRILVFMILELEKLLYPFIVFHSYRMLSVTFQVIIIKYIVSSAIWSQCVGRKKTSKVLLVQLWKHMEINGNHVYMCIIVYIYIYIYIQYIHLYIYSMMLLIIVAVTVAICCYSSERTARIPALAFTTGSFSRSLGGREAMSDIMSVDCTMIHKGSS